jgi:hypothetical protein
MAYVMKNNQINYKKKEICGRAVDCKSLFEIFYSSFLLHVIIKVALSLSSASREPASPNDTIILRSTFYYRSILNERLIRA